jgi:toxin ParE1/3/4
VRIEWSPLALQDRDKIFDYYEFDQGNPRAAIMVDGRIEEQVNVLLDHPKLGRPGRADDTRELVISKTPYIAAYRIAADAVRILRVLHGRQLWPEDVQD